MAKETRLNDDAQIYQARDVRTEKEKWKGMTRKEKLEYFNQYYRTKTIVISLCTVFLVYLLYSIFGPKVETKLYAAVIDGCIDSNTVHTFEAEMTEKLITNPKKATVRFDDSFYLNGTDQYSAANVQKLSVYVASGELDLIIAPEEVFSEYMAMGAFQKLSDCLPSNLFSTYTDNFVYGSHEDDPQESAYGIYLDEYAVLDSNGTPVTKPVLGIFANSKHTENAVNFIESLKIN